jgi:streptomycin 6-kinase
VSPAAAGPQAGQDRPDALSLMPDRNQAVQDGDRAAPGADRTVPDANRAAPGADRAAPGADRAAPGADRAAPGADRAVPGADQAVLDAGRAVPDAVRAKAVAAGADGWLDELPDIVAGLERDWGITVGRSYGDATEALVAQATLADGTAAVLKVLVPRAGDAAGREVTFLGLAGGQGCVALLRADPARGALLLERLGPSMSDLGLPLARRHEELCAAAARVWRPAPDCGLPTGAQAAQALAQKITRLWPELGRPCSERAVAYALDCARRRADAWAPDRAVLVHGDVHQWNALRSPAGFALVDPDGYLAEPEYDLGVLMREDPAELLAGDPRERSRWLARRCGLDETAIWEWGVVSRVETGLVGTQVGLQPMAGQMLEVADRVAP